MRAIRARSSGFNRSKGFGFILPDDGAGDVFLPLAVLERSGFRRGTDGASIAFEWVQGPKGRAATQVLDLDTSTASPRPAARRGTLQPARRDGRASRWAMAAPPEALERCRQMGTTPARAFRL